MTVLPYMFVCFLCMLNMLEMTAADSSCKLDLGLVVDTTKSIKKENIPNLKEALKGLVQQFDVSNDGTHVSFETFAKTSTIHNAFKDNKYHSEDAVLSLMDKEIDKMDKITRLDLALQKANDEMFTAENGDRPGVRSVMVLFTDGRSHPRQTDVKTLLTAVSDMKIKGVRLVVVAIGPDARKQKHRKVLRYIGGESVLYVDDYKELRDVVSDIAKVICPPNPCKNSPGLDVAFVVDRTESIGLENFKLLKGFLLQLTNALTIGPGATHTGIILFDEFPEVLNTFADSLYYSGEKEHQLIESIPDDLGTKTFIDRALKEADGTLFTVEGGDRPEFPNVLLLFTDGKTNENSEPFSSMISSLEAKDVRMIAIGVGKYENFMDQLKEIAGTHVYTAKNFNQLSNLFNQILEGTCSDPVEFSGDPEPEVERDWIPQLERDWHYGNFKRRNPMFLRKPN